MIVAAKKNHKQGFAVALLDSYITTSINEYKGELTACRRCAQTLVRAMTLIFEATQLQQL